MSVLTKALGKSKRLDNLEDLFDLHLKDLYDAESQIIKALPKMVDAASSAELKQAFQTHLEMTKRQRTRLEDIFRLRGMEVESTKCDGIRGILDEGEMVVAARGDPMVKDAALIAAAQQVEHYEIGAYGTIRTFAQFLGWDRIAELLQQTLDEEANTDKELSKVATSKINREAAA